ncbi:FG-GAP-like repeat-containing protein [Streptomyces boninensis]|uniref:FG-GAP-like repeat-containing protein n=1 Tax=Streptomyces boninensis TaxID=2039455 RepID=UPI003B21BDAE
MSRTRRRKPASRRLVWLALAAALASGAGVTAYAAGDADDTGAAAKAERPADTHSVPLSDAGIVAKRDTAPFSSVSLTWQRSDADLHGTAQIRTRSAASGDWSGWRSLGDKTEAGAEGREAAEARLRGSTELTWTGAADGVEARIVGADGSTAEQLPAGLTLELIDPGTKAATEAQAAPDCNPPTSPLDPAPDSPVAAPNVISRAAWGANNNLECPPSYGTEVKAVVVHHTATTNSYSCAGSAAQVRAIQQAHFANGWNDIGYNFLVDKCGRIFEGRGGGTTQPVVGAHDVGFNTDTVGIAYIGDTTTAKPSRAVHDAIARIAAWRLGQFGYDPESSVKLTSGASDPGSKYQEGQSVTLPRIFRHQDTFKTECPGAKLAPQIGLIRSLAGAPGAGHALATSDVSGDGRGDLLAGVPRAGSGAGAVAVVPGGDSGPVAGSRKTITQASAGVPGASEAGDAWGTSPVWADVNGDGKADLITGAPGEDGATAETADTGAVTVLYGPGLTSGAGYGDHPGGAKAGSAVAAGDFNADGKADLFTAGTGQGGLWWTRDSAAGAVKSGKLTGAAGALSYAAATSGDFNRDGYADVAVNYRDQAGKGKAAWFKGSAAGLGSPVALATPGGRSLASGDLNGDGYGDLVIGQPYTAESGAHAGGQVTVVYGSSAGLGSKVTKLHQASTSVPGTAEAGDAMGASVAVGDVNLDGYADVLTGTPGEDITRSGNRSNAGAAILLRGASAGLTGSGSQAFSQDTSGIPGVTETDDRVGSAATLTDFSGWARTDLAIGAEGEDAYNGTVLQLDSGSGGVSTAGVYYGRTELGTAAGARVGAVLAP